MAKIFPQLFLLLLLLSIIMLGLEKNRLVQYSKLEKHVKYVSENLTSKKENHSEANQPLNPQQLKQIAKSVTVKIFSEEQNNSRGGSGVIITTLQGDYFVITNNHVVSDENIKYKLQTYDGKIYAAEIIEQNNSDLNVDDLALLKFSTKRKYDVVKIKLNFSTQEDQAIFACGFPFQDNLKQSPKVTYTLGNLKELLPLPLMGGYQMGYTNNVHNGMSGGSIINMNGQLIGINGLGKEPLFGNPYIYQNGKDIPESKFEQMSQLSWGITSKAIVKFVDKIQANKNLHFQLNIVD